MSLAELSGSAVAGNETRIALAGGHHCHRIRALGIRKQSRVNTVDVVAHRSSRLADIHRLASAGGVFETYLIAGKGRARVDRQFVSAVA